MRLALAALIILVIIILIALRLTTIRIDKFQGSSSGGRSSKGTFTLYYADWCPHCKTIKPLFESFMGNGSVSVNGSNIKCRMVEEKQIQKGVDPDIKGYPSLLYTDAAGRVVEFSGPRTPDGFMQFLKQQILS